MKLLFTLGYQGLLTTPQKHESTTSSSLTVEMIRCGYYSNLFVCRRLHSVLFARDALRESDRVSCKCNSGIIIKCSGLFIIRLASFLKLSWSEISCVGAIGEKNST
uniref:AlNc14C111G6418 protein n=1 Tax=Albugo laibachii Nc14 TaxID=890382 RepID=F0WIL8_9STRA|nr:AlNc14C111G6418 [Albugo laibachii Nc14]|eukprot:CCA21102.1 AlNc14C111G6418 [Albugo laibachii Nc14]